MPLAIALRGFGNYLTRACRPSLAHAGKILFVCVGVGAVYTQCAVYAPTLTFCSLPSLNVAAVEGEVGHVEGARASYIDPFGRAGMRLYVFVGAFWVILASSSLISD